MQKALIAMSGGVDSSLAAAIMNERGFDCLGVTMLLLPEEKEKYSYGCIAIEEAMAAENVASLLSIPHKTVRMHADFENLVISPFVSAYLEGKTPNPCVECNRHIKFSALDDYARENGCDFLVTGHYARTYKDNNGHVYLLRGEDEKKDQTYFLWTLTPEKLKRILFPIGEMSKSEVRELAEALSLPTAHKKDSQDICFVKSDYVDFINKFTGRMPSGGNFTDTDGNIIGKHSGIISYTVGQRKGLGVAFGEPRYVISKDAKRNTVTLGKNEDLFSRNVFASDISLCVEENEIFDGMKISAKIRYNQPPASGVLRILDEKRIGVEFDFPVRAVSPGQSLVIYSDETVLCGGIID